MDLDGYVNDNVATVPKPCVAYPSRLHWLLRMKNTSIYTFTQSPSAIKTYTAAVETRRFFYAFDLVQFW